MRQRVILIAACLAAICSIPSGADEPKGEILTFEFGQDPIGDVASLPDWAPGNIAVTGFDSKDRTLSVEVNIASGLLDESPQEYSLRPGAPVEITLKNGIRFMFYHKARAVKTEVKTEVRLECEKDKNES